MTAGLLNPWFLGCGIGQNRDMTAAVTAVRDDLSDLIGRSAAGPEFGEAVAVAVGSVLPYDS